MVEARYASEGPDSIPADRVILNTIDENSPMQNRIVSGRGTANGRLFLRPGKYKLSAMDRHGHNVFGRDIEIGADGLAKQ
jgi:hypothetical protein